MPHSAPEVGGTFTYRPVGGTWWWSDTAIDLDQLEGEDKTARIRAAVTGCLVDGVPFALVVPVRADPGQQVRWTVWTGERTGTGAQALVTGRVVDISRSFQEAMSAQVSAQLAAALSGRESIDVAKGALMMAYGVDADEAFEALAWCSQLSNVRVQALAGRVAELTRAGALGSRCARDAIEDALVRGARAQCGLQPGAGSRPPGCGLTLRQSSAGGATVLAVAGALDLATAPELAGALRGILEELDDGDVLLVDLTEVGRVGPAGVWVLESVSRRSRLGGVELRIVALDEVRDALATAGMAAIVDDPAGAGGD